MTGLIIILIRLTKPVPIGVSSLPSASATSPTTSPDPYSRQADSDPDYTLHW
ncbi:hypothetical protein [Micromonospora sp. NPDC000668]|uniref:hypothetical protein n=1 Tax=Micromonospora sp. NPDC000668 TaxID=3364219 RepID=UPI003683AE72